MALRARWSLSVSRILLALPALLIAIAAQTVLASPGGSAALLPFSAQPTPLLGPTASSQDTALAQPPRAGKTQIPKSDAPPAPTLPNPAEPPAGNPKVADQDRDGETQGDSKTGDSKTGDSKTNSDPKDSAPGMAEADGSEPEDGGADSNSDGSTQAEDEDVVSGLGLDTTPELQQVILGKVDPSLEDLRSIQQRVNELVERLRPTVVNIRMDSGQGSGVIVTSDGYVLTAAHVVGAKGGKAVVVMPDGSTQPAVVLGTDSRSDSGMLRLLDKGPWPYADIGNSEELLEGQWVMALGHPGGFDPDRSSVVRVGRMLTKPGRTTLNSDCTLVGGDSGGPLFDMDGYVIGIHSRISRRIQQNYHVAIDVFTSNWDEMSEDPKEPYFGFSLKKSGTTDDLILDTVAGPAQAAGLQADDQLLKINGTEVKKRGDIRTAVEGAELFAKIKIVVKRDGKEVELELELGAK